MKIAPSILNINFSHMIEEVDSLSSSDLYHIDIMDGHFVPNISFGSSVIRDLTFVKPLQVHLMVTNPQQHFQEWIEMGSQSIIFQYEATDEQGAIAYLENIRGNNVKAGIALDLNTPIGTLPQSVLDNADELLLMSVKAGKGGQEFNENVYEKIEFFREKFDGLITVDGGVQEQHIKPLEEHGADIAVVGSFLTKMSCEDRPSMIARLRTEY